MKIISSIVVLVIVAAGAFYGGILYKGSQAPVKVASSFARTGTRFATGNNFVTGSIVSQNSQMLTVKSSDGSSKVIIYSPTTEVGKFVSGSLSDLTVGTNVMVNGTTNSDGSITASSIQIRPAMPAN